MISKPVILFLHGGPGSTMSQYGAMYHKWEKKNNGCLGLTLRALGAGKKVFIAQFVKGMVYSVG